MSQTLQLPSDKIESAELSPLALPRRTKLLAEAIATAVDMSTESSGKAPSVLAGACVAVACELTGVDREYNPIADVFGVSQAMNEHIGWVRETAIHDVLADETSCGVSLTFGCEVCGKQKENLGGLHAHIDARHRGIGPFNIISNPFAVANHAELMEQTLVVDASNSDYSGETA